MFALYVGLAPCFTLHMRLHMQEPYLFLLEPLPERGSGFILTAYVIDFVAVSAYSVGHKQAMISS